MSLSQNELVVMDLHYAVIRVHEVEHDLISVVRSIQMLSVWYSGFLSIDAQRELN